MTQRHAPSTPSTPPPTPEASADVVVIGGGLAGLVAAAFVARGGRSVVVRERRNRLGGLATTDERDGFLFNQGPHAIYQNGPAELGLRELGIEMPGGEPDVRGRLLIDGRVTTLPTGPSTLLTTRALGPAEKAEFGRLLATIGTVDAGSLHDVSVTDWIARSVRGRRSRLLVHALARLTTYVADPDRLSADVLVGQLQLGGAAPVRYLDGGWQQLIRQLADHPGVRIETGVAVDALPDAPAVIIAGGPPRHAAQLTGSTFEVGPSADVSCLDVGLDAPPPVDFAIGADRPFYFSHHSAVADLAPAGSAAVSAMQYLGPDDEPDIDRLWADVELLGVDRDSVVRSRRLHRLSAVSAIATPETGGLPGRPAVGDTGHSHVFVAGDWVGPHGHLADAVVASARAAAAGALAHLGERRVATR